jgi:hypothetical protein
MLVELPLQIFETLTGARPLADLGVPSVKDFKGTKAKEVWCHSRDDGTPLLHDRARVINVSWDN